jgi:sulfite exporter TauE/SafE
MLAALILGLAGSIHCVGMCGPLVLALPLSFNQRWQLTRQMLGYHSGRILTYFALGVVFGLVGKGIAVAGFQKTLSLVAGCVMIVMAIGTWRIENMVASLPGFGRFANKIKQELGRMMRTNPGRATFAMGAVNGLLPCGMVYAALAGAISTAETFEGGIFMLIFGVGTLPLMMTLSLLGHGLGAPFRKKIKLVQPFLLVLAGLLLIQRGLNLDLTLFESAVPKADIDCH